MATIQTELTSASTAATHWRQHLQARTDLLAGKISKEATDAIWRRTRLAGKTDVARIAATTKARAAATGGCTKLVGAAAEPCRQRITAMDAAASAGLAAARDWSDHLAKMAAHAAGQFGSQHAQDLWVAAYNGAPKNLNAFARAESAMSKAPTCRPA